MNNLKEIYKGYLQELEDEYTTYQKAESDSELILTKVYAPEKYQPFYNHMSHVLKNEGIHLSKVQNHWINILQEYFKELDDEVELKTSYNSVPTAFTIMFKDEAILRFSIYSHRFSEHSIANKIKRLEGNLAREEDQLPELERRYIRFSDYQENKFDMLRKENYSVKGLRGYYTIVRDFFILIIKSKEVERNLASTTESNIKRLSDQKNLIERIHEDIVKAKEKQLAVDNKLEEWKERFIDWGYEKEDSMLYS